MDRLNSEDFSKFFVRLDNLFWAFPYERTLGKVQKNVEFFRIFLNFHEFFRFLTGFLAVPFLYSELQSRAIHHWILHEILRRSYIMGRDVERKRYHVFYRFYGG